jgi:hypothetical protein
VRTGARFEIQQNTIVSQGSHQQHINGTQW